MIVVDISKILIFIVFVKKVVKSLKNIPEENKRNLVNNIGILECRKQLVKNE